MSPVHLLDAGVLIALTNPDRLHHRRAHEWFATIDAGLPATLTGRDRERVRLVQAAG